MSDGYVPFYSDAWNERNRIVVAVSESFRDEVALDDGLLGFPLNGFIPGHTRQAHDFAFQTPLECRQYHTTVISERIEWWKLREVHKSLKTWRAPYHRM